MKHKKQVFSYCMMQYSMKLNKCCAVDQNFRFLFKKSACSVLIFLAIISCFSFLLKHICLLMHCSFGQTAIFLIGGVTKEVCPVALYLRSGDICVMMEEARLAYHAVPRILPAETRRFTQAFHSPDTHKQSAPGTKCEALEESTETKFPSDSTVDTYYDQESMDTSDGHSNLDQNAEGHVFSSFFKSNDWERYEDYMKSSRINVNVRQVLQHGQTFPKQEAEREVISR